MNIKFKPGIMFFSIFTLIAIIFPPVIWRSYYGSSNSFGFLLSYPQRNSDSYGYINLEQLILEIVAILIISVIFQLNYDKIKKWYKNNS